MPTEHTGCLLYVSPAVNAWFYVLKYLCGCQANKTILMLVLAFLFYSQHCHGRRKGVAFVQQAKSNHFIYFNSPLGGYPCERYGCACMYVSVCVRAHACANCSHSPVKRNILREITLIVVAFKSKTRVLYILVDERS